MQIYFINLFFIISFLTHQTAARSGPNLTKATTSGSVFGTSISGTIERDAIDLGKVYILNSENKKIQIQTNSNLVQQTLDLLTSGDSIIATGSHEDTGKETIVYIYDINFVGLKKVIGSWSIKNSLSFIQFSSFNDMGIISQVFEINGHVVDPIISNYKYTISPNSNKGWVLFYSDPFSTQMALLKTEDDKILLDFISSDTGEFTRKLELNRVKNP
jgi:hypothetical protein